MKGQYGPRTKDSVDKANELLNNFVDILEKKITIGGVLKEAIHYSSIGSGKRIRGFLTSETAKFFKAKKNHALNVACAIELVHSYSLIHDDLPALDNDALRRNKPSNHIKFSEATAILAGDALQVMAFEILSNLNGVIEPSLLITLRLNILISFFISLIISVFLCFKLGDTSGIFNFYPYLHL